MSLCDSMDCSLERRHDVIKHSGCLPIVLMEPIMFGDGKMRTLGTQVRFRYTNSSLFCLKCTEPALRHMLKLGCNLLPILFLSMVLPSPGYSQDWNFFRLVTKCYRDFFLLIFIIFSFPLSFYTISLLTLDLCCCDGFLLISHPLSQILVSQFVLCLAGWLIVMK